MGTDEDDDGWRDLDFSAPRRTLVYPDPDEGIVILGLGVDGEWSSESFAALSPDDARDLAMRLITAAGDVDPGRRFHGG